MTQEEEIAQLNKQLSQVVERLGLVAEQLRQSQEQGKQWLEQLRQTQGENHALKEELAAAKLRIEELEKQKTPPPAFVKANVVKPAGEQKKPRKKREARFNRARRREKPTRG